MEGGREKNKKKRKDNIDGIILLSKKKGTLLVGYFARFSLGAHLAFEDAERRADGRVRWTIYAGF